MRQTIKFDEINDWVDATIQMWKEIDQSVRADRPECVAQDTLFVLPYGTRTIAYLFIKYRLTRLGYRVRRDSSYGPFTAHDNIYIEWDHNPIEYDIIARVRKGAEFLEKKYPGWLDKIDLDTLDMYNPKKCVLGQLFGFYGREVASKLEKRGFDILDDEPVEHYSMLTKAWRDKILRMRGVGRMEEW